jgi:hypothetical protein
VAEGESCFVTPFTGRITTKARFARDARSTRRFAICSKHDSLESFHQKWDAEIDQQTSAKPRGLQV